MFTKPGHAWRFIGAAFILLALLVPLIALTFGVRYDYTLAVVALGGAALGLVTGALGCFAVLRRQSLMGDALSHAALPGVGMAFLVAGRDLGWLMLGAGIASWLGVAIINAIKRATRIKQDAAMGMVLAAFFAFGIALLSYIQGRPDASQAGLDQFIFGQAAAMVTSDVILISLAGLAAFIVMLVFWKEFKLVTFDPEFAGANGFRVNLIEAIMSTLIVVAIVLGLQLAGVILMVGMLIAPAVAARQWTHHLEQMVVLAGVFGAFAGATGAVVSAAGVGIPTGPLIIVVASALVFVSLMIAPERGIVWRVWQQRQDRRQFAARKSFSRETVSEGAMD
jgi:manganese/zinc/iron transport system permease protein